ncbi:hypothetical protein HPB50_013055 [Hyalomma asiaticum]|uniref:Uncharacterized protein n=1 Tax=Hyalomma asiaticum TaxID=266040 RepID=A0ACB7SMX1_HYAAI|nr:hypothetical protein HPB50_013055 [Hyalomma asiaticum]
MCNEDSTKRMLEVKELKVKGRRCIIVDPQDQQVRLRLHWLLHGVADEDVSTALAAFGKVVQNVKVQETPPGLTPPEQLDSRAGDRQEKVKEGSDSQKAQSSGDQDSEGPQYE